MKRLPLFDRYDPKGIGETGRRSEKKVAESFKAKMTRASGAMDFDKGDFSTDDFLMEAKSTIHKSISVKHDWLTKIRLEALSKDKFPALVVTFVEEDGTPKPSGTWVAVPETVFNLLRSKGDEEDA